MKIVREMSSLNYGERKIIELSSIYFCSLLRESKREVMEAKTKQKRIRILTCPTVVRIRRKKDGEIVQDCQIYIGRRLSMGGWSLKESIWANPYKVGKDGTKEEVVEMYEKYIRKREDLLKQIWKLSGKTLGCFCKNKPDDICHGDSLVKIWREQFDILVRLNKRE